MSNTNKTTEHQNQLVADAKIQITNTLRRLRKLNVNLDFIHSTYQPLDESNPVSVNKSRLSELHTQLNDALDTLNELTPTKPNPPNTLEIFVNHVKKQFFNNTGIKPPY